MKTRISLVLLALAAIGCSSRTESLDDLIVPDKDEELIDEGYFDSDSDSEWPSPSPTAEEESFWLGKFRSDLSVNAKFFQVVHDQAPMHVRPDTGSTVVEILPQGSLIELDFAQKDWARTTKGYYIQLQHITAAKSPGSARFK